MISLLERIYVLARVADNFILPSLGLRIDRVLADLPSTDDLTQEELEEKAQAHRVAWQVIAYALTRKQDQLTQE